MRKEGEEEEEGEEVQLMKYFFIGYTHTIHSVTLWNTF